MKDLEIRGAGNLLGGEQSGHIAGVGFDLYVRLVGEAVAEFKGDVDGEAPGRGPGRAAGRRPPPARLRAVRAAAAARPTSASPTRTTTRRSPTCAPSCVDRYGPLPEPVERLLEVARLRVLARRPGSPRSWPQGAKIRFGPVELPESAQLRLSAALPGHHRQARSPYDPGAEAFHREGGR